MPPNQTILGVKFFEIEYLPLIQHIFPLILSCRNLTLRSKNNVSECDTPIQEYCVGTWHSDPRIPCRNVTFRSKNIVSEHDTPIQEYSVATWHSDPIISLIYHLISPIFSFVNNISSSLLYSRHFFDRDGLRLYISRSRDFRPITKHTTKPST